MRKDKIEKETVLLMKKSFNGKNMAVCKQVSLAGQCCQELFQTGWYTFISRIRYAISQGQTVFIPQGLVVLVFLRLSEELPRSDDF